MNDDSNQPDIKLHRSCLDLISLEHFTLVASDTILYLFILNELKLIFRIVPNYIVYFVHSHILCPFIRVRPMCSIH